MPMGCLCSLCMIWNAHECRMRYAMQGWRQATNEMNKLQFSCIEICQRKTYQFPKFLTHHFYYSAQFFQVPSICSNTKCISGWSGTSLPFVHVLEPTCCTACYTRTRTNSASVFYLIKLKTTKNDNERRRYYKKENKSKKERTNWKKNRKFTSTTNTFRDNRIVVMRTGCAPTKEANEYGLVSIVL